MDASPLEVRSDLPADLHQAHLDLLARAARERWAARLWERDATLWTGGDEGSWLAWLDAPRLARPSIDGYARLATEARDAGFSQVLLLGMGGSSLGPEVLASVIGAQPHGLRLAILDSTVPDQLRRTEAEHDLEHTLIVVASKSGSTLEPSVFFDYFFARAQERWGEAAGARFIAITDPGSQLETLARQRGVRAVVHGVPEIGGRYSALSPFGLLPAALLGVDLGRFLDGADEMAARCRNGEEAGAENPGLWLGTLLGAAARTGRDKVTFSASRTLRDLGAWLEQLIAESTGKRGMAILPIDGETVGHPDDYGTDRLFVDLTLAGEDDDPATRHESLDRLVAAGHPVVRLTLVETHQLGAEFLRWEVATAFAGAALGVHPFDQPDVEASKIATRKLTTAFETAGALPEDQPFHSQDGIALYAREAHAQNLIARTGRPQGPELLRRHFATAHPGDYFGLLAWIDRSPRNERELRRLQNRLRDRFRIATSVGFGPRFLHSTGQAHKGGPNTGVFLQITADSAVDAAIPDRRLTFGTVAAAQAQGDFEVLASRGRRILRVHLDDAATGLDTLERWLDA